jgi:DNA mismatch repair ATPase MutS
MEAAGAFRKLSRLIGVFDLRLSLFSFFVNGLFLSDLICALAYLRWNKRYQSTFKDWFDAMGEIEMLNSVANFHYNHPSFVFPEIVSDRLVITATGLGHPLMKTDTAVCNDFSIGAPARLHLITGSNMSGKSTFLRTVGLNMVLAQLGAPVFAQSFRCRPVRILTSFHHIDSLEESTSYFYAELKCLQTIIQSLAAPEPALVLLDEVMRGTNSTDKHDGTALLIQKIVQQNCLTLIATHDIELGILATQYPGMVENFCFESEVTETGLHFDFRKRNGIAQSKNATYLMKQMGIV